MKLGKKILELRKKKGLSQEQLGEKVNVTRQTISNWELEETTPNPEQLKLLSKVLNISIDELLDNDIQNVVVEKVSNTEKLAGLVLKVLKWLGIIFIIFLVIDVVALILFSIS
ncbi:MAG: helix-turn-helix transcriptional regulator, partial [Bacilli bacterium]|nr:helix-turn-helix transcriptional regulator [Bacilli bacterium]